MVTGGASFIGSHLVEALLEMQCVVTVVDDFSSGKRSNLPSDNSKLKIQTLDLSAGSDLSSYFRDQEIVFHLAAVHGGRRFIEKYPQKILKNLILDQNVFEAAINADVKRIVHASSACSYPTNLQDDTNSSLLLSERYLGSMNSLGCQPDGTYGWTKLIGEYQLEQLIAGTATSGRSARIFTAYGERENESHAAIALIAKALLKMDPFVVWGSGHQTRNFTYVTDTVRGLLHLGADDRSIPFDVLNIGTSEHISVNSFIETIFKILNWRPMEIFADTTKPQGVASRASDNSYLKETFNWERMVSVEEGLRRTIDWYSRLESRPRSINALDEELESP